MYLSKVNPNKNTKKPTNSLSMRTFEETRTDATAFSGCDILLIP
jgi:hypothetical protein